MQGLWHTYVLILESIVVSNGDKIIHKGRQIQSFLRLPRCLHIISDLDPGMLDLHLKGLAYGLAVSSILHLGASVALLGFLNNEMSIGWAIGFEAVAVTALVLTWLLLARARRRRKRSAADDEEKTELLHKKDATARVELKDKTRPTGDRIMDPGIPTGSFWGLSV